MKKAGLDRRISARVQSLLPGVESVHVVEAEDRDGDPIVRVTVVLGKHVRLDSRKKTVLVTKLIDELMTEETHAFPVLSFMSSADGAKFKRELA